MPFLAEKVGIHRWSAVVVGFCGMVVIAAGQGALGGIAGAPGLGIGDGGGAGAVLGADHPAGAPAFGDRKLHRHHPLAIPADGRLRPGALPFFWVTPTPLQLVLLVLVGLIGGAAQWLLTEAWASAQVSALAPYSYSALLWSVLFGWVAFGDVPGPAMLAGGALIVAAGLYILHRELVRRRQKQGADTDRTG